MRRLRFLLACALPAVLAACSSGGGGDDDAPAAAGLNVAHGFARRTHVECDAGETQVPVLQLFLTQGGRSDVVVEGFGLRARGTFDDAADVAGLHVALDVDNDGAYTAGVDTPLSAASPSFAADDGEAAFTGLGRRIDRDTSESWIVTADFTGSAPAGSTFQVVLDPPAGMVVRDADTGEARAASGLELEGALVTAPAHLPAWSQLTPAGTAPLRYAHTAVLDAAAGRLVVFGGTDGTSSYADLRALDLTEGAEAWSFVTAAGSPPAPRNLHSAFVDAARGRMVVFGGADAVSLFQNLWTCDLTPGSEAWNAAVPSGALPEARYAAHLAFLPGRDEALLTAGRGAAAVQPHLSDQWSLDLSGGAFAWNQELASIAPGASLSAQAGAVDVSSGSIYQFGGLTDAGGATNVLYAVDPSTSPPSVATLTPDGPPCAMAYAAAAFDDASGRMLVWGGFDPARGRTLGRLYAYDPAPPHPGRWILVLPAGPSPTPRCQHTLTAVPGQGRFLLFGGARLAGYLWSPVSELWELR